MSKEVVQSWQLKLFGALELMDPAGSAYANAAKTHGRSAELPLAALTRANELE